MNPEQRVTNRRLHLPQQRAVFMNKQEKTGWKWHPRSKSRISSTEQKVKKQQKKTKKTSILFAKKKNNKKKNHID